MCVKKGMIVGIFVLLIILLFPRVAIYEDGGTKTYSSILYKIIVWHQINEPEGYKEGTEIHLFPNNFKHLDDYDLE